MRAAFFALALFEKMSLIAGGTCLGILALITFFKTGLTLCLVRVETMGADSPTITAFQNLEPGVTGFALFW